MKKTNYITVGDIAKATGLSRQGVYFYEKEGLIEPAIKTENIKLYDSDVIDRVNKIKELGEDHKLSHIKDLLNKN